MIMRRSERFDWLDLPAWSEDEHVWSKGTLTTTGHPPASCGNCSPLWNVKQYKYLGRHGIVRVPAVKSWSFLWEHWWKKLKKKTQKNFQRTQQLWISILNTFCQGRHQFQYFFTCRDWLRRSMTQNDRMVHVSELSDNSSKLWKGKKNLGNKRKSTGQSNPLTSFTSRKWVMWKKEVSSFSFWSASILKLSPDSLW